MLNYILSKRAACVISVALLVLAGCLPDNGPIVQVVPRIVLAPQNPRFQAISCVPGSNPPAGAMRVSWHRSIADTQLNFKGYFVELYQTIDSAGNINDTTLSPNPVATASIYRTSTHIPDTFCVFTQTLLGPALPLREYDVIVYGVKADSFSTLSTDSSEYYGLFDPLPFSNPTNLQATSDGPTQVKLHWDPSPNVSDTGFYRYVIYYRDTTRTPFDSGHAVPLPPKGKNGSWDTTSYSVYVPAVTPTGETTAEWPYQFWIKAERNDSSFFYGNDTNSITWAGAEQLPHVGNDTGWNQGYLHVRDGQTVFFGSANKVYDAAIDTFNSDGQISVSTAGGSATLSINGPYSSGFMSRIDQDSALNMVYYTSPLDDPAQFDQSSITLPSSASSGGAIVYLMMTDPINSAIGNEWVRIFVHTQRDGTFVNPTGGVDIKASFQPAVAKDGTKHLPYY